MSQPIRDAFRAYLLADAAIAAVVVDDTSRVFPRAMPHGEDRTSLVYQSIGRVTDYHMEGASGLVQMRMQLVAWSRTNDDAWALAELARQRLSGAVGLWPYGASPPDYVRVQSVFLDQEDDEEDTDAGLKGARRDYIITFEE